MQQVSLDERIKFATQYLQAVLVADAPYDTGNLALNSIRIEGDIIKIGGEIAPYAVFTNEPWTKGTNPNEGWIQRSIEHAMPTIRSILGGVYAKEDIQKYIDDTNELREQWQEEQADKLDEKRRNM